VRTDIRENGRIVLAWGESTGHLHEVVVAETGAPPSMAEAQFFEVDGRRELIVLAPCVLRHEEHAPIALDPSRQEQYRQGDVLLQPTGPGTWEVRQQQEWAGPDAWRAVAD
jgi:hypothetical protein